MASFFLLRLDESEVPRWVPTTHLMASTLSDSISDILGGIRLRAKQEGATIRRASVAEFVLAQKQKAEDKKARKIRYQAHGVDEVAEELVKLFGEMERIVAAVKAADATVAVDFGANRAECAISSPSFSTSLSWQQRAANNLHSARLQVNDWRSSVRLPTSVSSTAGSSFVGAFHYVPQVAESDIWVWRRASELDEPASGVVFLDLGTDEYSTPDLADYLVRRHFRKALGPESE